MRYSALFLSILVLASCEKDNKELYSEKYRPQFHFSPPRNWANDPNGLVFYKGEYHLFYQYNPYGDTWGHMSWGHAVSTDLLHWENLPVAIGEYLDPATGDSTMVYSGTVVVDENNSSGLCTGKDCMIAIYTSNIHRKKQDILEHQSIAFSNDAGRTWTRYDKNPVLSINRMDFRDPKVFWYEPQKKWVMVVAIPTRFTVGFYESQNLTEWKPMSQFHGLGDTTKIWECPDLYPVTFRSKSGPGKKWVLSLSSSHPQGPRFTGMQYFVGEFDGTSFKVDDPTEYPQYIEYGKDFFAGIVVNHLPVDTTQVMIAWANSWAYGKQIPTSPWRSAMSIPRLLSLNKMGATSRLVQQPIQSISSLRGKEISDFSNINSFAIELNVEISRGNSTECGIRLKTGDDEAIVIGYIADTNEAFIDRTKSGNVRFNDEFASLDSTPIGPFNGPLTLRIFIDHSIIEVFINNGERVLTEQFFPTGNKVSIEPYHSGGDASIQIRGWEMKSIWKK